MPDSPALAARRVATAALAVAGTYGYFLIFPQFAFLHALRAAGESPGSVRALMGAMALAGVAGSWLAGRAGDPRASRRRLLLGAALGALAGLIFAETGVRAAVNPPVALLAGFGLGLLTVSLAASLRALAGPAGVALACGLGTGLAYGAANLPPLFNAAPSTQSAVAAAFAALVPLALLLAPAPAADDAPAAGAPLSPAGFRLGLACFVLLIWLDSACFTVIQETDTLRLASWGRDADLLCNGAVHALVAIATGIFFRRGLLAWLTAALALLVLAALLLEAGGAAAARAHPLYAAGVSVYSALLVAWLPLAHGPGCAPRVATLYALAGWVGSALGVGMALDLHRIPAGFLVVAVAVFAFAWTRRGGRAADGGTRHD